MAAFRPAAAYRGAVRYRIFLKAWAAYQITVEPPRARSRLHKKICGLMDQPRPVSGEALPGHADRWRLRLGGYRIVYSIDEMKKAVTIIAIGHRQNRSDGFASSLSD